MRNTVLIPCQVLPVTFFTPFQRLENQPFTDPHAFCTPSRALLMVFLIPSQAFPAPALIPPHKFENQPVTALHTFLIASHAALNIPTMEFHNFLNHAAILSQFLITKYTAVPSAIINEIMVKIGFAFNALLNNLVATVASF